MGAVGIRAKPGGVRRWRASSTANFGTGNADGHLVHADPPGARDAEAYVGRQHEEGSHRVGVTRAGGEHGIRKGEQAFDEARPRVHHCNARLVASREGSEVEAGREDALPAGEDGDRPRVLRGVERVFELSDHLAREGVDLAVVHRDPRDSVRDADPGLVVHAAPLAGRDETI
jgi:hypothetical protein